MKLKRYLKILPTFFKLSFQTEMEYRANFIFWSLENLLWLVLSVSSVTLIFGQVNSIAGWTKNEVFLIMFVSLLFSDISWTFLFKNLENFSLSIRYGELDNTLLKPINTRFLISFMTSEFNHCVRIIIESYFIYKYTLLVTGSFSLLNLLIAILLFVSGWLVFYSLFFMITVTNIWFINVYNLLDFFGYLQRLGRSPVYIYQKGLLFFFSFILPAAYTATFPTEALLGRINPTKVVIAPFLAIIFLYVSQKFFRFALKHYSSASS
jgi:ABC-2 type transport system permease protein